MYFVRVPLFCLALAAVITACHRESPPVAATPASGPLTAMDSNRRVLGPDGRCAILVDVDYSWFSAQAELYELPLQNAMKDLDEARARNEGPRVVVRLAHKVRRAYAQLITKWYKPFLESTGGPFRCRARGRQAEEVSSDDLHRNVPGYMTYVQSIQDIPEPRRPDGTLSRIWETLKDVGSL